jgi:hypothetical protein
MQPFHTAVQLKTESAVGGNSSTSRPTTVVNVFVAKLRSVVQYNCSTYCALRAMMFVFVVCSSFFVVVITQTNMAVSPLRIPASRKQIKFQIKFIYRALLTSADISQCCTETQPKTTNSKQYRCRSTVSKDTA